MGRRREGTTPENGLSRPGCPRPPSRRYTYTSPNTQDAPVEPGPDEREGEAARDLLTRPLPPSSVADRPVAGVSTLQSDRGSDTMDQAQTRIAILDDYQRVARSFADWSVLEDRARIDVFHEPIQGIPALVERLKPYEIVCLMRERTEFPRALIEQLPNLKLIVTAGPKNAAIDVGAATDHGVLVCGTRSPAHATAELAFGLIIALARGIVPQANSVANGGWQLDVGRDIRGATLGIVGLGRLGGQIAEYGKAFGMKIIAWSQNLTEERAREVGAARVDKRELFARADFVTIHLRLSERTRGLVGASEFKVMKRDAYLVNTSRGPIVDRDALIEALERRYIAGAAVDVYDTEPLPPDDKLRRLPGLLATPHLGYVTRETYRVFYTEMVEDIRAYLDGAPVRVIEG
jgi:phosphoglycerate dehydrogenase-like enzyme